MVSSEVEGGLVYNIKVSSVGPGRVTGSDKTFHPGPMDLAMKLHYLRGVYYFGSPAFEGLTILAIKEPTFTWLNQYPMTCGRLRRSESGRAYIKCNDCGVRFIEARCDKTLDEWLVMADATDEKLLCSNQVIGPELSFSPLVLIQLTKFGCGGTAVGLSMNHVLGDAFFAAEFMNMLGRAAARSLPDQPIDQAHTLEKPTNPNGPPKVVEDPLSVKRVDPVGDNWVHVTTCKMGEFSFIVGNTQLSPLKSILGRKGADFTPFEAISAVIWQCIARIRVGEMEPRVVTICKRGQRDKAFKISGNSQIVSVVKAEFSIAEAVPAELAWLMQNEASDEHKNIEESMDNDDGLSDFIIYGANLTFVNLEEAKFYDFEYQGQKTVRVSYRIDGVDENGAVLVHPEPKEGAGRLVTLILPQTQILQLKWELKREGFMP